ncbi:MAG: gas vesicle protein K [Chloroflexota bacterium]|nr:gas vesicle protein K [Chloroflexota bacterium]
MTQLQTTTSAQIIQNQHVTLLELLDRLLDKGVMVKGEILLTVADIDLVYLNLGVLLSSVKTVTEAARKESQGEAKVFSWLDNAINRVPLPGEEVLNEPALTKDGKETLAAETRRDTLDRVRVSQGETRARTLPVASGDRPEQFFGPKATIDPKNVEKGLAKLVLTLVDLLRKLMEKQAIRRIETDQLSAADIEKLGNTFLLLDERLQQLKETFDLKDEDLNLDLGPLGELL